MSFRTAYGNAWSENGWRMCNRDECTIINVPGLSLMDTAPVRTGYAAEALSAWAAWYDRNVPGEIVSPTWGWSAQNDVGTSNHLSGTALDINAPQYPWGGSTMARSHPDRVGAIRRGLQLFEGIIFWGADWDRKDEMHFQLGAGTAAGTGASGKLIDFVQRRVKGGQLIGDAGTSHTSTVIDVARVTGFTAGFNGAISADTKDIREQVSGMGSRNHPNVDGWPQLGGRSLIDAFAAIMGKVQ